MPEQWARQLTNVLGVALTIRATLPPARTRQRYQITSPVVGRRSRACTATGRAVTATGEALRAELRQMHDIPIIRVTLIEPG
jgi:NADP-dependent 3-hydroxy acid dehydrogenase YdfG